MVHFRARDIELYGFNTAGKMGEVLHTYVNSDVRPWECTVRNHVRQLNILSCTEM